MRSFLYGRYDVLRGARGYEIFAASRELSRDLIRQLTPCFSTQDPHFSMLQTLADFYVYFPTGSGEWVFGRGCVEERGDYSYYMLHGLVLDESQRKSLDYNPFRLAHLLRPQVGDDRRLPLLTQEALANAASMHEERCLKVFQTLAETQELWRFHALGLLMERLLRLKKQQTGGRLVHDYHPSLDANLWIFFFELLPLSWRKQLSVATLDAFLKLPTHVQGSFQPDQHQDGIAYVPLTLPEPTALGQFLLELAGEPQNLQQQRLQLLNALRDDAQETGIASDVYADQIEAIAKALIRPSIRTMQRWQTISTGRRLFAWKAHFLIQVWERHAHETQYFPNLAATMVASMQADYERLQSTLSPDEDGRLRQTLDRLILRVEGLANRELILMVLGSPRLAADYFPKVEDQTLVEALFRESLEQPLFESLLRNRLQWRPVWSEALNQLWSHPQMLHLPPDLLAQIFDALLEWDTRLALSRVLQDAFLDHPERFESFLKSLTHGTQILSRVVSLIGRQLAHASAQEAGQWLQLLGVCLKVNANHCEGLIAHWIKQRQVEYLLPKLAQDPALGERFLDVWTQHATDRLERLRVLYLAKCLYPQKHPYQWPRKTLVNWLKRNAMFEYLMQV